MAYLIEQPATAQPQPSSAKKGFLIEPPPAPDKRPVGFLESTPRHAGEFLSNQGSTFFGKMPGGAATIADNIAAVIRGEKWIGDAFQDTVEGRGGPLTDIVFRGQQPIIDIAENAAESYRIKPDEEALTAGGKAGAVVGTLGAALPGIIAMGGPKSPDKLKRGVDIVKNMFRGAAGMSTMGPVIAEQKHDERIEQGMDPETARQAMYVDLTGYPAMGAIPISAPGGAVMRGTTGAAINIPIGLGMRAAEGEVMGEKYKKFHPPVFGGEEMTMDAGIGLVMALIFGGRGGPAPRRPAGGEGGQGEPPGPPPVDPELMQEYRDALESNGITDPSDPRAPRLIGMIMQAQQRRAEQAEQAQFGDVEYTLDKNRGYVPAERGEVLRDTSGKIVRDDKGRPVRAKQPISEIQEEVASGERAPAQVPWAGRQQPTIADVIGLGEQKIPGRPETVTTGTGEPGTAAGVERYIDQRAKEAGQTEGAFTMAGRQRQRKQQGFDEPYDEALQRMEENPDLILENVVPRGGPGGGAGEGGPRPGGRDNATQRGPEQRGEGREREGTGEQLQRNRQDRQQPPEERGRSDETGRSDRVQQTEGEPVKTRYEIGDEVKVEGYAREYTVVKRHKDTYWIQPKKLSKQERAFGDKLEDKQLKVFGWQLKSIDASTGKKQPQKGPDKRAETARKRHAESMKVRNGDGLLTVIAKRGGLSPEAAKEADIDLDGRNSMRIPANQGHKGVLWLVHKNGWDLDTMREMMVEEGLYRDGKDYNELINMIGTELRTGPKYRYGNEVDAMARDIEARKADLADRHEFQDADEAMNSEDITLDRDIELSPKEMDAILNEIRTYADLDADTRAEIDQFANRDMEGEDGQILQQPARESGDTGQVEQRADSRTEENRPEAERGDTSQQRPEGAAGREGGEADPLLRNYDEAELRQRQNQREEADRATDARQREADAKQRADQEREDFELTGSERDADANPKQADLDSKPTTKLYSNPFDPELVEQLFGKRIEKLLENESKEMREGWKQLRVMYREASRAGDKKAMQAAGDMLRIFAYANRGMYIVMANRYPDIKEVQVMQDMLATDPGSGRLVREPYEWSIDRKYGESLGKLSNILGRHKNEALEKEVGDMLSARKRLNPNSEAGKIAMRIRPMLDKHNQYLKDSGLDVGYTKDYFPRIPDYNAVVNDPKGAMPAAEKIYRLIGLNQQTAKEAALDWMERVTGIKHGAMTIPTMQSQFTKGRKWPPEADKIMEKYLVTDLRSALGTYFRSTIRKAEFAKRFGVNGEIADQMFADMMRQGMRQQDMAILRAAFDSSTGLMKGTSTTDVGGAVSWLQTIGMIRLLPRAVIPSMAEGYGVGIQSQSAIKGFKSLADSYRYFFGGGGANALEIKRALELSGLMGDVINQMLLTSRFGGGMSSHLQQQIQTMFYKTIQLSPLTDAQRMSGWEIGGGFIRGLLSDVIEKNARMDSSIELLADLGIAKNEAQDLMKLFNGQNGFPKVADLMGDNPAAELYRQAIYRFVTQAVQAPHAVSRPRYANDPVGRLAYGITSFIFEFQRNMLRRTGKQVKSALTNPNFTVSDRVAYLSSVTALAMLAALQSGVSEMRERILNPETHEDRAQMEKFILHLSRTGLMGAAEPFIQAFLGIRYQRDPGSLITGPYLTAYLSDLAKAANLFIGNNENTNSAEHNALRSMYHGVMAPVISTIFSMMPGGPAVRFGYGIGLQALTSPQTAKDFADMVIGEKDSGRPKNNRNQMGKGMKKQGMQSGLSGQL